MKIVVPIADENFSSFENGGHAPLFAILEKTGSGMWSGVRLVEFRNNPKANPESPGQCDHDHGDGEEGENHSHHHSLDHDHTGHEHNHHHDKEHNDTHGLLADTVADCDKFIAQWACGRTRAALKKKGVEFQLMKDDTPDVKLVQDFLTRNSNKMTQIN